MEERDERRRAKRHIANPKLIFRDRILDVKNISTTGIAFYFEEEIDAKKVYSITLAYPPEEGMLDGVDLNLQISIRYSKQDTVKGNTLIGAQFENLDEKQQEVLTEFTAFLNKFNSFWGLDWHP